jgi:hypothetical protein
MFWKFFFQQYLYFPVVNIITNIKNYTENKTESNFKIVYSFVHFKDPNNQLTGDCNAEKQCFLIMALKAHRLT